MEIPDVQYARSGDVAIAYQIVGEGPTDIVFARGFSGELLSMWEHPLLRRHVVGLAEAGRVLMLDKRGTGLSDRMREAATLEARMDDLGAVMDAAGSQRAVFWASLESARLAILFAATYPERTSGLVLLEPSIEAGRRPTTRGRRATRSGAGGSPTSASAGAEGTSSRSSWSSGRPTGPRTRSSSTGS